MYDRPTIRELLAAVREFLHSEAMPALTGRRAFHARVAANALGIVERELEYTVPQEEAALARLRGLLGRSGSFEELQGELCRRIRAGEMGFETPGLLEHLRATTLAKLAVDQPHYASYRRALEEWGAPAGGGDDAGSPGSSPGGSAG